MHLACLGWGPKLTNHPFRTPPVLNVGYACQDGGDRICELDFGESKLVKSDENPGFPNVATHSARAALFSGLRQSGHDDVQA